MDRVRIGATIATSFSYIRVAWGRASLAMAFLVGLQALEGILRLATPQAGRLLSLAAFIPLIAFGTVVFGALYRIGVERGGDEEFRLGTGGVQWNGLEWRVLGANIIAGLILAIVAIVCLIAWAVALGVSMAGHLDRLEAVSAAVGNVEKLQAFAQLMMGPAGLATLAVAVPSAVLLLWLNAKLALFSILAADTRSFDLGKAWAMTRGATWALIVTGLVILAVQLLVGMVFGAIGGAVAGVAGGGGAAAVGRLFGEVVGAAINTPLTAGMQIAVYRARRPGGTTVADAFA
jgi:hypothetical protein